MRDRRPLAVVCVSGGMDSAVTAALAALDHRLAFLHADYGQRTEVKERACFSALADHYGVSERLLVDFGSLRQIGGSSLTDASRPVPEGLPSAGVPTTYVPFRNAHLLAAAVSWGEVLGASAVFVGAVGEDSSGYPDCRPEFYTAFQEAVRLGTRPETGLRIVTPVIHLRKWEIARRGHELGVPFEKTWSCYQAEVVSCGRCASCLLRRRGFAQAGLADPVPYPVSVERETLEI
jgi:7-cyano-7-deazaguanine synthase